MSVYAEHGFTGVAENLGAELGSCPDFVAERLLKEAFIRFCHDTEAYRHTEKIQTEAAKSRYELAIPKNTYILRAEYVNSDKVKLNAITTQQVSDTTSRYPIHYYTDAECMVLSPIPAVAGINIKTELILVPTLSCTGIPMDLYGRYWYTIRALLFSNVFLLPDTAWFDASRAEFHLRQYRDDLVRVIREAKKHNQNIQRTVRYGGI